MQPDSLIMTRLAFQKAHILAMKNSLSTSTDPGWKDELNRLIAQVEKETPVFTKVTFRLKGYADAKEVSVAGSFNDWSASSAKMKRQGDQWIVETIAEPGKHMYKFVIDGQWIIDPANKETEIENGYTNSVVVIK